MTFRFPNRNRSGAATAIKPLKSSQKIDCTPRTAGAKSFNLEKIAVAMLDGKPPAYEVMRITTVTGERKLLALRRSDATSAKKVLDAALNAGAALPHTSPQAKALVNRFIASTPIISNATIVTRGGWHKPGCVYLRNNSVIRAQPLGEERRK